MKRFLFVWLSLALAGCGSSSVTSSLREGFVSPPDSVRPGVYWYFMDGCLSTTQMTKDLEAMRAAGIGNVLFLEVNLGMPRGDVSYFSEEWQRRFLFAVRECERLGIEMTLGVGPGWSGSGGPWVKASESMRHIVASDTVLSGNGSERKIALAKPKPRMPFFGEGVFTEELKAQWLDYYDDVAVLAFPVKKTPVISDVDEKAIYYRAPFSSQPGVKPHLAEPIGQMSRGDLFLDEVVDLTAKMDAEGVLSWQVPEGEWRILRFGMRNNGAITRPAPYPGLGFECDKFDSTAFADHFAASYGKLMPQIAPSPDKKGGLKTLHMDSWEMGAQNWTDDFAAEFEQRRGYAPLKYLPAVLGVPVEGVEVSERFLWDLRKTAEELVVEQHAEYIKTIARRYGLKLSIEPYDMTPMSDVVLGEVADIPMCEFWTPEGGGFNTTYSSFEATSIAHLGGKPVVRAEAFTTNWGVKGFANYPATLKNQGDWAFAAGINQFFYHTFVHKYFENEAARPGMTMGGYGVNWDRGQTWWHLSDDYHKYVARCSYLLQQGNTVADILYLSGEDSPYVFRPPFSALDEAAGFFPDRKGYNFDACTPGKLLASAEVKEGRIVFPGGASYAVLVLPMRKSMTPALLTKIEQLIHDGATVVGNPPQFSPSLSGYPECDQAIHTTTSRLWGDGDVPQTEIRVEIGKGMLVWGGAFSRRDTTSLYPGYQCVAELLQSKGIKPDFSAQEGGVRYTHRRDATHDIFFVSNRTDDVFIRDCRFRTPKRFAELWNPVTGEMFALNVASDGEIANVNIRFEDSQSWFVVFADQPTAGVRPYVILRPDLYRQVDISNDWDVRFDPLYGGVERATFNRLTDWKEHPDERIKYYSGSAFYTKKIELNDIVGKEVFIAFDSVCNLAKVTVNGKKAATLWTTPWRVNISEWVQEGENTIEVEVANLWVNRLIGDESKPYDGVGDDGKWPEWALGQTPRQSGRYSYSTCGYYTASSPLEPSGLIGNATIYVR